MVSHDAESHEGFPEQVYNSTDEILVPNLFYHARILHVSVRLLDPYASPQSFLLQEL